MFTNYVDTFLTFFYPPTQLDGHLPLCSRTKFICFLTDPISIYVHVLFEWPLVRISLNLPLNHFWQDFVHCLFKCLILTNLKLKQNVIWTYAIWNWVPRHHKTPVLVIFTCSQSTVSVHFVSLLEHNGQYVRVSDNHPPTIAGRNEIKKAEIFIYRRLS